MVHLKDGLVTFRLYRPAANRVDVQGSFNGWQSLPLERIAGEPGWWTGSIKVEPGEHEFQYVIDNHEWIADYAASGVRRNAFGLWVSLLYVPKVVIPVRTRLSAAA